MGRITDSWSGKQKFHIGLGREGNKKLDEYQQMIINQKEKQLQPKKEIPFEERLKRARVRKRKPTKAYKRWLNNG